jgi:hypothetical protein
VWNEFFYMEFDVKSYIDFKTAKIKISVFDVNKFLPNVLVCCNQSQSSSMKHVASIV